MADFGIFLQKMSGTVKKSLKIFKKICFKDLGRTIEHTWKIGIKI